MKKSKSIKLVVLGAAFLASQQFGYTQNSSTNTPNNTVADTNQANLNRNNGGNAIGWTLVAATIALIGYDFVRNGFGKIKSTRRIGG